MLHELVSHKSPQFHLVTCHTSIPWHNNVGYTSIRGQYRAESLTWYINRNILYTNQPQESSSVQTIVLHPNFSSTAQPVCVLLVRPNRTAELAAFSWSHRCLSLLYKCVSNILSKEVFKLVVRPDALTYQH